MKIDTNDFKNLDFIRSIAVLLVLFSHLPFINYPSYYHVQTMGIMGVFIFFVHTSFVLMLSLKRMNFNKYKLFNYKFYIQRFFRIYPLVIFVVSLIALLKLNDLLPGDFNLKIFFKNIFLIQEMGESTPPALWSLPYEVAMYLFLPFIFNFINTSNAKVKIFTIWFIFVILVLILKYFNTIYFSTIKYVPFFLCGIIGYVYYREYKKKISSIFFILYIFFSIICIPILVMFGIYQNFLGAIFCMPLGILIGISKDINFIFLNKVTKSIAKYSYGIYLFHEITIYIFLDNNLLIYKNLNLLLLIIVIFIISVISYKIIEHPFVKLGKKISMLK